MQSLGGYRRLRLLLASSSVAALLIGGGAPPALAASCSSIVTVPFNNAAGHTTPNVCVNNASFTGNIINEGTISSGIAFVGGTISGYIYSIGIIDGGVSLDGNSEIASPTFAAIQITGGTFTGGISNSGTISAASGIAVISDPAFAGGISNSGTISAGADGIFVDSVTTFTGDISNSGTISAGADGIFVDSVTTFTGDISNSGTISAGHYGIYVSDVATFTDGITNSGTISATNDVGIFVDSVTTFTGDISNSGTISAGHYGIYVSGVATFTGGITNSGTISATNDVGIFVDNVATFAGGITNSGTITAKTGIYIESSVTFAGGAIVNTGTITGTGGTAIDASAATSPVTIDIEGGAINGNMLGAGLLSGDTLNFTLGAGGTFAYAGNFTNFDTVNINSGTVVLEGTDSATTVAVNGGTLAGTGTLDAAMTINAGGTLAPGTPGGLGTLAVVGSLTFSSGSYYGIDIAPGADNNSKTAVTGGATINGGTVVVTPELGKYNTVYQILTTTTGVSGTFASSTPTINGDFVGTMTVDYATNAPNDVDLDVVGTSLLATPPGANQNQQNVAGGINNAILGLPANTSLPLQFENLGNLSGAALLNALTQLSGEAATGAEQSAFQLTTEFLDLMLDPFVNGRGNLGGGAGEGSNPGLGFAPDQQASLPPDIALAYDEVFKAAPKQQNFEQRWGAWGSAYGGSSTTEGDPGVGSHDTSAQTYGFAAGMDYHVTPHSVAGFALAGGGTGWGLSDALGSGYSQAFQFGGYGIDWFGHAYLAGALSFSNHWFTTNRTALGDQLRANFVGQSYAARLEGGYRLTPYVPWGLGVTPYGAVQFQDFHTPAYSEADLTGGGLGLSYNAMNATDVRTELGARFDDPTLFYGKPLILFGRLAWAHDFVSDPALSAVFEALPGSAFTVNGAPIPHDSALTTAGAQYFLTANWSVIGKFEGEFAGGSQTYAGTGTLRYTW